MSEDTLLAVEIPPSEPHRATVIWLHGLGANGYDFQPVVQELGLAERGVRFVLPHAPFRKITLNNGQVSPGWYDILALDGSQGEDEAGIRESELQLCGLIDAELARGIPANRIVIAGFSQGGAIVLHTGIRFPQKLGGVMALSTYLPLGAHAKLEHLPTNAGLEVFYGHGTADTVILQEWAEGSAEAMRGFGCNVEYHEYAMAHSVNREEIADIRAWLVRVLELD